MSTDNIYDRVEEVEKSVAKVAADIADLAKDLAELRKDLDAHQQSTPGSPVMEKRLDELRKDLDVIRMMHKNKLAKLEIKKVKDGVY